MTVPDFRTRSRGREMMDDLSGGGRELERALENLRQVNRWLGGYSSVRAALEPLVEASDRSQLHILDVGTGAADVPEYLVRWGDRCGVEVRVTGLDANPVTTAHARRRLDERLPERLRSRIQLEGGDALAPRWPPNSFDVVTAALFLHHFPDDRAAELLDMMRRIARLGIVVSDLHRHPIAYWSIRAIGRALPVSPMFAHDGPLSVLRGFRRSELASVADAAGIEHYRIDWRWAFRWVLTTL